MVNNTTTTQETRDMKLKRNTNCFIHHTLSGLRENMVLPEGTICAEPGVEEDVLYGEPVLWFKAVVDQEWLRVGTIDAPTLSRDWKDTVFVAQ